MASGCGHDGRSPEAEDLSALGDAGAETDASQAVLVDAGDAALIQVSEPPCVREETFEAVHLGEAAPFDVVIVADHSDSLSWSRDALAAGLRDLLAGVRGRAARFFVLTPTQYGASSAAALEPISQRELVGWKDPASGIAYAGAVTEYTQSCSDTQGQAIACPGPAARTAHAIRGSWGFRMPAPSAVLTPTQSDAEFAQAQRMLSDAILNLPAHGSSNEQPLCTLARYLQQPRTLLPQHAIVLVIADEDDISRPAQCVSELSAGVRVQETPIRRPCTQNCDALAYQMTAPSSALQLTSSCVFVDDQGVRHTETARTSTLNIGAQNGCSLGPASACSESERQQATNQCGTNYVAENCQKTCVMRVDGQQCNLDLPADQTSACAAPFDHAGKHYQNLLDFCQRERSATIPWQGCRVSGVDLEPFVSTSGYATLKPLVTAATPAELADHVKRQADVVFGADFHRFAIIGFHPRFACVPQTGQSYAENLSRLLRSPDDIFPICESYAPALAQVGSFAEALVVSQVPLALARGDQVGSVRVIDRTGAERSLLKAAYRYDAALQQLVFTPGALSAKDRSLNVQIVRACAVVLK